MTLLNLVTNAPLWVWALLALLVLLGLRATRDRTAPVWLAVLPAMLVLLPIRTLTGLGAALPVWLVFAAAYGTGIFVGARLQPRWITGRLPGRVGLRGETLTLALMLLIFLVNYALGVARAIAPDLVAQMAAQIGFAAMTGLPAGIFAGRAAHIATLAPTASIAGTGDHV